MAHIKEQLLAGYYNGEYDLPTLHEIWLGLCQGNIKEAVLSFAEADDKFKATHRI